MTGHLAQISIISRVKNGNETDNLATIQTQMVGRSHLNQLHRPSTVLRLLLFLTFDDAHYYPWEQLAEEKRMDTRDIYSGFLRPRPFGLGWASMRAAYSGSEARFEQLRNLNRRDDS